MMASGDGRSLEAAASGGSAVRFKTGDVVVAADPLVHVLARHHTIRIRCDNCYAIRLFHYCGRDCQQEDWKSFHKHGECRLFHKLSSVPEFDLKSLMELQYSLLFLRTDLLLKAKPELMQKKFKMDDGTERSLADVAVDAEDWGLITYMYIEVCTVLMTDWKSHSEDNMMARESLFHKIRKCFLITRGRNGFGLYVPISGFKHSCRPNASYVFKGKKLEVRAMRDIAEGEDVTIDLADLMKPKAGRIKELSKWRGIRCDCDRCREGDQEDEVTKLAANEEFRKTMSGPGLFLAFSRPVFDAFLSVMEIKEKYLGRYHPEFVISMFVAANAAFAMPYKTVRDKQNFDLLVERLKEAIPLSYGLDSPNVNIQGFQYMRDPSIWSNLLPQCVV